MPGSTSAGYTQVPLSDLRGSEWASLMWGFFWRGLVYTLASMVAGALVGGIVGAVIGAVMGAGGSSVDDILRLTRPVGFVLGVAVAVVGLRFYLGWLLAARFGQLRLAVLRPSEIAQLDTVGAA